MATADTAALTLDKFASMSNDPAVSKITYSLYKTANVLKDIPLVTKPDNQMSGIRYIDGLPSVTWGEINRTPTVVSGKPEPYQSRAYWFRNQFQFDVRYLNQPSLIVDPVQSEFDAWMESLQYTVNDAFINNDPVTGNDRAVPGLKWMLANPTLAKVDSNNLIDAGGVVMTDAGMTSGTASNFIRLFTSALIKIGAPDGEGVTAYMNSDMMLRFEMAVRLLGAGGGFTTEKDGFDRQILKYRGVTLRDIGPSSNSNADTARIITSTENAAGTATTGSVYTSIYFVKYGEGSFSGWQTNALKPKNLGVSTENGVFVNVVVDWGFGLWIPNHRSIARLYDIKVA